MSDLDVLPIDDIDTTTADGHIACCRDDQRFLCGAPPHPEAAAEPGHETCHVCTDAWHQAGCPSVDAPTHRHCPLAGGLARVLMLCPRRGGP